MDKTIKQIDLLARIDALLEVQLVISTEITRLKKQLKASEES